MPPDSSSRGHKNTNDWLYHHSYKLQQNNKPLIGLVDLNRYRVRHRITKISKLNLLLVLTIPSIQCRIVKKNNNYHLLFLPSQKITNYQLFLPSQKITNHPLYLPSQKITNHLLILPSQKNKPSIVNPIITENNKPSNLPTITENKKPPIVPTITKNNKPSIVPTITENNKPSIVPTITEKQTIYCKSYHHRK